jgi:hypothetical protein
MRTHLVACGPALQEPFAALLFAVRFLEVNNVAVGSRALCVVSFVPCAVI